MENDLRQLKIIRDFFQIRDDGQMPEGSRLLLEAAKPVRFEAGEDLMTEGAEPDDGMYIFLEGKAQVLIGTNLVNELSEGDVAGELALIKDGVRKATVRAATPVLCASSSASPAMP